MSFAPQQDWAAFQTLTRDVDRKNARELSLEQRFARYEDLFGMVCMRQEVLFGGAAERRWADKLALRQSLNAIYRAAELSSRG